LYSLGDDNKENEMGDTCGTHGRDTKSYSKNRNGQLGRFWRRWDYNITIKLKEIDCICVEWFQLAQNRVQWEGG